MEHIEAIREAGGVVSRSILIATATGIVKHHDRCLLAEHGGSIELGRGWSNGMVAGLGYVNRKGMKAASWVCSSKSIPLATVAKDPEILLATNNFL